MKKFPTPRTTRKSTATARKTVELATAAPQVIMHRLTRMALAGPLPNARDRKEFTGMVAEKQLAFTQAWIAMCGEAVRMQQQMMLSWLPGAKPRSVSDSMLRLTNSALAPIHRKAVSNAKRLARTKLR